MCEPLPEHDNDREDLIMRLRASRTTRLATCLAAGAALTLAACGSDDGGGGSTEAFCEEMTALAESGDNTTEEQDLAALRSAAEAAPGEISDEMDELVEGLEQLQSFDADAASEEEMTEFLAIAGSLDEASTTVEQFAKENCPDLPADFFGTE
jgi:hypothetical protein